MRPKGSAKATEFVVFYFILATGLLDDAVECRIMHVADFWKKMMLNLKIESAKQPG